MNKTRRFLLPGSIVAAAVGLVLTAPTSHATLNYLDGDLLLGFQATSGTGAGTDYLVDIGAFTQYTPGGTYATIPGATVQLSIGSFLTDLNTTYGDGTGATTNWQVNPAVFWGVAGVQKAAGNGVPLNTMFATVPETGGTSTGWTPPSPAQSGGPSLKIQTMGQKYAAGTSTSAGLDQLQSTHNSLALFQFSDSANSYETYQPGGNQTTGTTAFSFFNNGIEANFGSGLSGGVLDLYEGKAGQSSSIFLGSLQMSSGGNVEFTSAVPEPTSFTALAMGAGLLVSLRRQRRAVSK